MPNWAGSDRRERLPADWEARRKRRLRLDGYRCTAEHNGERCAEAATDVDHFVAGDDHREANLRSLCGWHHQRKSSAEGGAARAAARRRNAAKFSRTEAHPGLL